ncbi:MAG: PH domain-containing protein [Bacteroidota bacterium]
MNYTLQIKEVQQQLKENSDSIIWSQKASTKSSFSFRMLQTFGIVIIISTYMIFESIDGLSAAGIALFSLVAVLVAFRILFYEILKTYVFATIVYSITPNHITFEWGYFKKKKIDIPFKEITAINLVGYQNKNYSTIHFGTSKAYEDILRVDFKDFDSRPHITFEKIKEGQKVYDLLQYLKNSAHNR